MVSTHSDEMIAHPQVWVLRDCNEHWYGIAPSLASVPPTIIFDIRCRRFGAFELTINNELLSRTLLRIKKELLLN